MPPRRNEGGLSVGPEPVFFAVLALLALGALIWVIGRSLAGPEAMTDLPRVGQLSQDELADCTPGLLGDHLFRTAAPGFIPDPAFHEHQRGVLERCLAPFVLWTRVAAASCEASQLERIDQHLGRVRPLADALDALVTDSEFRGCYASWLGGQSQ